ncbi:hypothetical protein F441_22543 [Phytophthora nicotianae CJ01A1]|uniref:Uncharacterized protein n=3 Tax=Phytophthora nicotianae TaxID=4792 RepID=W2QBC8_PHYN3|nr:hypothetical protein PPTG_10591 [Phytophthora nicotianae INRA-310]ETK88327.1 hypothetical protein L915_07407 [Phytophthora nicotianae]ETP00036.1 hypothetical protein F441_22543 [Phytophthora nicotianae CJ01A1]KUF84595.1 NPP1 protein [Phytophthora nicotianae]ETL41728.1 hypothetical protein L916_07351 [Phytophthora nicotianae]ETM48121.1 hypothetical protein L914_07299 [Phytophthora nicotianae]
MKQRVFVATLFATLVVCTAVTIDHDKVQAFPQPEPVTASEKTAIKFKPRLYTPRHVCVPYPAVNAAGEVSGGLKGTNGNDACKYSIQGSQVYGRAGWYRDLWAIMYTWYFPKGFFADFASKRHDWQNVVVWINNPDLEWPKIVGVSMSNVDSEYTTKLEMMAYYFSGYRMEGTRGYRRSIYGSATSLRFAYEMILTSPYLDFADEDGEYQSLIMWEQLTDAARAALNDSSNFEEREIPFSDEHYMDHLEMAWPL